MFQITSLNDVQKFYNLLLTDKASFNHPQIQNLSCRLLIVKSSTVIFHTGENTLNQYILLVGKVNCYIPSQHKHNHKHEHSHDPLVHEISKRMPFIQVWNRPQLISQDYEWLTSLAPNDHFGEHTHKRTYTAFAVTDTLLLEMAHEERLWRFLEIRSSFLSHFEPFVLDKSLVAVCMKKAFYKFGEAIYKCKENTRLNIYFVLDGQIQFTVKNLASYYQARQLEAPPELSDKPVKLSTLGALQMFGYEEILMGCDRLFTVSCVSASAVVYRVSRRNINLFNGGALKEQLAKRLQVFDKVIESMISATRVFQHRPFSKSLNLREEPEDYSQFTSIHWLKDLRQVPRWNQDQMIRDMGAVPGGAVKSVHFTPKSSGFTRTEKIRKISIFEVNLDQHLEMLKTYSKRLRSEKYADLHKCLQGQWERIFKKSEFVEQRERENERRKKRQNQVLQRYLQKQE